MKPKAKNRNKTHNKLILTNSNTPLSESDYAFTLTQIAVSQICQSLGFTTTTLSTLKTLTHITTLFLQTLAKTAVSYSNHSNRTQPNLSDTVQAIHDLAGVHGFAGASVSHQTQNPFCSEVLKDVSFFVNWSKEIPFAKPIVKRSEIENWVGWDMVNKRRGMDVPEWLPGFPEGNDSEGRENGSGNGGEMVKWERSMSVVECGGNVESNCGGGDLELGVGRGRVKFRIGERRRELKGKESLRVQRRSGVCIGGKRVCWNYLPLHHVDQHKSSSTSY